MKKSIAIISILLGASTVWADLVVTSTLVTDDFNRTVGHNSGGAMGAPGIWTNGFTGINAQWGIVDGEASANLGTGSVGLLVNKALGTVSGNGNSFVLSADVKTLLDGTWAGVMFNYTDENNYYYFRYKSNAKDWVVQAVKNGVHDRLGGAGTLTSGTFANNTFYTLTVSSIDLYTFDLSIKETSSGISVLTDSRSGVEASEQLSGGYGGLYQATLGNDRVRFDNFSLEVIPEPATMGLFGAATVLILLARRIRQ